MTLFLPNFAQISKKKNSFHGTSKSFVINETSSTTSMANLLMDILHTPTVDEISVQICSKPA